MKEILTTLLLVLKDNKILLAEKKKGFGFGKFNGVGGKVEPNETVEQAMIRETIEEIGVRPTKFQKRGIIAFNEFYKGERQKIVMNVFTCSEFEGNLKESEEMKPCWFSVDDIPYYKMFEDDRYWLPYILDGCDIIGDFEYDENFKMLSKSIEIVNGSEI